MTDLILRPSPFSVGTVQHQIAIEGASIAEILRAVPDLPPEVWTHGVVTIGDWEIPRANWERVKPKAASRYMMQVGVRLHGGGGGKGGKNPLVVIAAIALVVVATAISGGALGPGGFASLSSTLFAAGSTSASLAAAGVSIVGALALNALAPPPSAASDEGDDPKLGSSSVSGNALAPFAPIPFVAGRHRVAPPHLVPPWSESSNDDQFIHAIFGLNGAHLIEDILINDAPIVEFPDLEYEVRDVVNDDTDLTLDGFDRQYFEDQLNIEMSSHKTDEDDPTVLQDQVTPANSYPRWHTFRSKDSPDEIWINFLWASLYYQSSSGDTANALVPFRIRIRRVGSSTWINLPEFHANRERKTPFRGSIILRFEANPGGITRPDEQDSVPPWGFVLFVDQAFTTETDYDTDPYFEPLSGIYAENVAVDLESGNVIVYLDPATFPQDKYEISVIRGYAANTSNLTEAFPLYQLEGTSPPFFFSSDPSDGSPSIQVSPSKAATAVSIASVTSVWNDYPLGEKGISLVAVRAKNTSISDFTVLATGYVNDWNGEDWARYQPSRNPASIWRHLALGGQSVKAPFVASQLDDEALAEWFEFCGHTPAGVSLDASTYLTRGAGLTGAADSKLWSGSFWIRPDRNVVNFDNIVGSAASLAGSDFRARIEINGSGGTSPGGVIVFGTNGAGTTLAQISSSVALPLDEWSHVAFCIDTASSAACFLYVNDVDVTVLGTVSDFFMDFTLADWSIGARTNAGQQLAAGLAELWIAPGVYVDFSVEANRRKFIGADGRPVGLGTDGGLPTGTPPLIYLSGHYGQWNENKGTGGDFTVAAGEMTHTEIEVEASAVDLECNAMVDGEQSLGEVLKTVAAAGRAAVRASDKIGVVIERDRSDETPIQLFTQRNSKGLTIRRAFPRVPHGFRIRFNDEGNDYKPAEVFIYRQGYDGSTATDVEAVTYVGITNELDALQRGQLDFDQLIKRAALYNLETDIENIYCTKGSLVALAHDTVRRHHDAARVVSVQTSGSDVTGLTLDSALRLDAVGELQTVVFDGVNDYLTRGAGLTGAADSKLMTFSVWFKADPDGSGNRWFLETSGTERSRFVFTTTNKFEVTGVNSSDTLILRAESSALEAGKWYHALCSFDLSNTGRRHIYINDVSDLAAVLTYTNDTMDFTRANWAVGAQAQSLGDDKFRGGMAELWFAPGVYLDLSVEANRRKFRDADGRPVFLGTTGNVPTGSAPLVYLSGGADEFATNKGTGGGFTEVGALGDGEPLDSVDDDYTAGVVIQLKDGSTLTKEINETSETNVVTFATPFAIPDDDALESDCLVACGPFNSEYKRMLVLGVKAQNELTASLTLIDEAAIINQRLFSPDGSLVLSPSGDDMLSG